MNIYFVLTVKNGLLTLIMLLQIPNDISKEIFERHCAISPFGQGSGYKWLISFFLKKSDTSSINLKNFSVRIQVRRSNIRNWKLHSFCRTVVLPYIQSCNPLQFSSCKMPSILIDFTFFLQGHRNPWINGQIASPK